MSTSSTPGSSRASGPRGPRPGGNPFGGDWPGGLWDAVDHLRDTVESRVGRGFERAGSRMARGDVRAAILAVLAEEPMHGYQVIHAIEERSGGLWKPSPGSVYPTLQMLADEGLVTAEEQSGRKTYSLTEAGRAEVEGDTEDAPWEHPGMRRAQHATAIPKAGSRLAQAAAQVAGTGTPEQVDEAVAILEDARRKLYAILARD
jgi:DNA-binding PadR family transcriptional regulator